MKKKMEKQIEGHKQTIEDRDEELRLIKKNIQDIWDENEEIWSESKDLEEERNKFEGERKELKNEILTLQD